MVNVKLGNVNKKGLRSGKYPDTHVISFPNNSPDPRSPSTCLDNLVPLLVRTKPRIACMKLEQGRFNTRARLLARKRMMNASF
jgi:hypothetical protein